MCGFYIIEVEFHCLVHLTSHLSVDYVAGIILSSRDMAKNKAVLAHNNYSKLEREREREFLCVCVSWEQHLDTKEMRG